MCGIVVVVCAIVCGWCVVVYCVLYDVLGGVCFVLYCGCCMLCRVVRDVYRAMG